MATEIGAVIDGKYEILKLIGKGGMSFVYLAMDKRLNKQWAVKEIKKTANGKKDEVVINSLIAEANLMKRLDHPTLPRIVDIIDNGQTIYVVMDYIEGESLDKILDEYGPQPQELVIDWAKQLCDALSYLHSQKPPIIYRDMKPANVMLKPEGNIKVIDFGIAREYKEQNLADTTILGTRGYAPPEQFGKRQTTPRSDIYALGMTMHHLVTGADPRMADYKYAPIRQWNPELSGGLERIIDKCTAIDPDMRYQNCNELMYALEHYEEEDDRYQAKQKHKLAAFIVTFVLTIVCLVTGVSGQLLKSYENSKNYESKIGVSASTPYEEKVESYLEAIDLFGSDTRGYLKLLEAYEDEGQFGDTESSQFMAKYNANKDSFDTNSEEYLDLMYKAGQMYFYFYSGGDNSFRTRMQKAADFFENIVASENEDYTYYGISSSYNTLINFYQDYVYSESSVKEPNRESYESLLESLQDCMDSMSGFEGEDAVYAELTIYKAIFDLMNNHRTGMAYNGVNQESVIAIVDRIYEEVSDEDGVLYNAGQQVSQELRDEILNNYDTYIDNINRAYTNASERQESTNDTDAES